MTPPAVGFGTLARIAAMPARERPVLSAYLDFDRSQPASCLTQFDALLGARARQPARADRERVRMSLRQPLALAHGTRSIAVFAAAEGAAYAMVPLPAVVEAMIVVEAIPWLEPVAGMLTSGDWGAVVLDQHSLRLLRGGEAGLVEFASSSPAPRYGARPRSSSRTAPQAVRRPLVGQVQQAARMLARAHARRPFERLVLAAPRELWAPMQGALPNGLSERTIGAVELRPALCGRELSAALIDLLARNQDGRRLPCERSTATASRGGRPAVLSQTSARLVHPLPHAPAYAPQHPAMHPCEQEASRLSQAPPAAAI